MNVLKQKIGCTTTVTNILLQLKILKAFSLLLGYTEIWEYYLEEYRRAGEKVQKVKGTVARTEDPNSTARPQRVKGEYSYL